MPIKTRAIMLELYRKRYYQCATKSEKTLVLDEFQKTFKYRPGQSYSRKYAIKILRGKVDPRVHRPGPKPKYGDQFTEHLKNLWELMNRMCSKKMVVAMPLWLPSYKGADSEMRTLLLSVSSSTIDRLLRPFKYTLKKGLSTTKPSAFRNKIPIKLLDGEVTEPGYIEADTVSHCGERSEGPFVSSLTMTNLYSGWTENRAIWTKSAEATLAQIKNIERRLPFSMTRFACDSGSEFINEALYSYFRDKPVPIDFHRRRPYRKNDAAHVEQKNYTHVRQLFGYDRFDNKELCFLMNEIYQAYWLPLWNYFTPAMKLIKKERVGSKIRKIYDKPKTPCDRLIDCAAIPSGVKKKLIQERNMKNPVFLKNEMDHKLKIFFRLVDMSIKEKKKVTWS